MDMKNKSDYNVISLYNTMESIIDIEKEKRDLIKRLETSMGIRNFWEEFKWMDIKKGMWSILRKKEYNLFDEFEVDVVLNPGTAVYEFIMYKAIAVNIYPEEVSIYITPEPGLSVRDLMKQSDIYNNSDIGLHNGLRAFCNDYDGQKVIKIYESTKDHQIVIKGVEYIVDDVSSILNLIKDIIESDIKIIKASKYSMGIPLDMEEVINKWRIEDDNIINTK